MKMAMSKVPPGFSILRNRWWEIDWMKVTLTVICIPFVLYLVFIVGLFFLDYPEDMPPAVAIEQPMKRYMHINIATIFYYTNVPEQTDSTPNIMASGNRVYEGAVAVSRDYLKHRILKYGDKIHIEGLGEYVVEDTMNKRHKWSVDVFTFDLEKSHSKPVQRHIYFKPKGE